MTRLALVTAALAISACAINPVTGQRQLSLIPESEEIRMGTEGAAEVASSMGLVQSPPLQALVSEIGTNIARKSERPALPWKFQVADDSAVNAFALPGGYVFVTRGLLAYMENEAELACVIGHEIGHVTAKHSVVQMSQQQVAQLGLGVGSVLAPGLAKYGQLVSGGLGLAFLKFGRDDESQADELGFRYALDNGWDVRTMPALFETLDRVSRASGGGSTPEWLSTHPNPENRFQATQAKLATLKADLSQAKVNRDGFLKLLQGLPFGTDPRKGYVQGTSFLHPDMKLRIDFPTGWKVQSSGAAAVAQPAAGDAVVQFGVVTQDTPEAALRAFLAAQQASAGDVQTAKVREWATAQTVFTSMSEGAAVQGRAAFVRAGNVTLQVVTAAPADKFASYDPAFQAVVASLQPLTDPKALAVQPAKLDLVTTDAALTLTQFAQKYPSTITLDQLAILNGLAGPLAAIPAGSLVKRVIAGTPAQ